MRDGAASAEFPPSPAAGAAIGARAPKVDGAAKLTGEERYGADDILLFGRESAGVPEDVARAAAARLVIPIKPGLRSLNIAVASAMALGEALRQTGSAPKEAAR